MWKLCCSLKLAIFLASLATFLLMGGSLLFPGHPEVFNSLDSMPLGKWLPLVASHTLSLSWWLYAFGMTTVLLALNTLCCFSDWLINIQTRWRKIGEYLIHLGVILLLSGFCWGAICGWRHIALPCAVGKLTPLPQWPGHYIAVDSFQAVLGEEGRPMDMISQVRLLAGEHDILSGEVRINHPLLANGLVITPASFGRIPSGFRVLLAGDKVDLQSGSQVQLKDDKRLEVLRFLPDARLNENGQMQYRSDRIGSPALEIRINEADRATWQGWYFLSKKPPEILHPLQLRPLYPLYTRYSTLTITKDPGIHVTASGGIIAAIGCFLTLFSFYHKRKRTDRPEL
ncbi:cytochrome c biogenesis protein ResB [Geopsychrobacter electrodiphilus]|uniref:cytochrome c biogenesis protein ResB n=1 Tax=Geopsychrobacter electrodiphilus TaxID=225196 RepID=UPI000376AE98|nr:cytochrome c biogenesis protein ResB [Geopsychrobacter electrodiphilus]